MAESPQREQGSVQVTGGRVWYARLGGGDGPPLLVLHGGPGAASYYMEPLAERLAGGRQVIVYDQLGCGRSDMPDDSSLWTVDRFCEELDQVRDALGLDRCHLLGQSWGGWLAVEYMCRQPSGIQRLVLASTSASIPQFMAEARLLIEAMPEPHRGVLLERGGRGEYEHPEYQAAVLEFYRRHLCRMDPWPEALNRSAAEMDGNQVYLTMNGPTEFDVIGSLRTWDRVADLGRIRVPTLVTCGRYDELPVACSQTLVDGIPNARLVIFEDSAHIAHLEQPELFASTVDAFLQDAGERDAQQQDREG
jgi:proline-specific peptidase